jgi:hypothetical protein
MSKREEMGWSSLNQRYCLGTNTKYTARVNTGTFPVVCRRYSDRCCEIKNRNYIYIIISDILLTYIQLA